MRNKEKNKLWQKTYAIKFPKKRLLNAARRRAKDNNLEFNITEDDIVIPEICPYLGISLINSRPRGQHRGDIYSLDRIDSSKGYIKGNVEVISHKANTMKSDATPLELTKFAEYVLYRFGLRNNNFQQGASF